MPDLDAEIFTGLTEAQREAVSHLDGPLLVLAGPGSGKTTVVTRRVAHLIDQGIPAWQILALTFTNKAAREMRERVDRLVPADAPGRSGLTIATFHSFAARLLRRESEAAGIQSNFSIYDSADQRAAVKRAITEAELGERNFTPSAVAAAISSAKNRLLDAEAYASEATDFYTRSIARAFRAYERILRAHDALDFDDLLLLTARVLRNDDAVRTAICERYQYLLVDEYQDTNHAQFTIAATLAHHRNVAVVGDPDQSIYGWRGADIRNILEFEQQYPEAKIVPLGQNFRSTGHILAAADALIQHNTQRKHKPLFTELEDGEKPQVIVCRDEYHEANAIVAEFKSWHEERGLPYRSMAVLYRTNALSRVLEEGFRDAQIPYVIARGTAFYERKEIKDALSYLRLIVNPNDEIALRRIVNTPTRGLGATTLDRIDAEARRHSARFLETMREAANVAGITARGAKAAAKFASMIMAWRERVLTETERLDGASPLAALVEDVIRGSGLEGMYGRSPAEEDRERLENLEELINAAAAFVPEHDGSPADDAPPETTLDRLAAWLESVALVSDADAIDPERGAVTLMTLHAAKGLEFDGVAIVGLESGLLPHMRALEANEQMEEERRLCFVGMTRAKRFLRMTRATVRTHRGMRERTIESGFLRELPAATIERIDHSDLWPDAHDPYGTDAFGGPRGRANLSTGFEVGAIVRHPKFGVGRVDAILPRPAGSSARVTFESVGMKTLILEYARLEAVAPGSS